MKENRKSRIFFSRGDIQWCVRWKNCAKKDVINVVNGENLGRIDDLQMNAQTASVTALILYGRPRLWGIFGPRDNCIIDFRQIRLVGKDVILVELGKMCTDCTNIKLN